MSPPVFFAGNIEDDFLRRGDFFLYNRHIFMLRRGYDRFQSWIILMRNYIQGII